ncbi:hypothetical protein HD554DRAFT_2167492 [Boletus coccyginus]|nr:hypothetical protein HD554DRAFT_2167492 [Boletus coccyginus]
MTPSVLLTAPTSGTDPLNADCHHTKRHAAPLPSFGVIIPHCPQQPSSTATTTPTTSTTPTSADSELECDAYYDASWTNRALANARQWTGAPIRAVVPLPRRKLVVPNQCVQDPAVAAHINVPASTTTTTTTTAVGPSPPPPPPSLRKTTRRSARFRAHADIDCGPEIEEEDGEPSESRCCSYESITAAEGLSAWSFEELRVECYAQSLVARGTIPPPVFQPSLAIPPAFVPHIVPRS